MKAKKLIDDLSALGYNLHRQVRGSSHQVWHHPSGASITISLNATKGGRSNSVSYTLKTAEREIRRCLAGPSVG